MNYKISNLIECNIGLPQGSVFGPLLLTAYRNYIQKCLNKFFVNLMGDDTLISDAGTNCDKTIKILNEELFF